MSKQNKWKQIPAQVGTQFTISDEDMTKLSDMLPNAQSDVIDDLDDFSTFIYYKLINMCNTLQDCCKVAKDYLKPTIAKTTDAVDKDILIKVYNIVSDMANTGYHTYADISKKLTSDTDVTTPLTEEEIKEFEKEDNEITKKMREQGIPEGRIPSRIKDKPKEPMATVPNEPVAKDHLAGETTPEEDALISQAIKNAVQGVM